MIIHSYENSQRADTCIDYLKSSDKIKNVKKLFLLPIPSSRDKRTIWGTTVDIFDVFDAAEPMSLIVGYGLSDEFLDAAEECGCMAFDVSRDEDFLLENAELTALATLGIILTSTKKSPVDTKIGVVGYGRIGKRLCRHLLFQGARVRVYTSTEDIRLDLCECGIETLESCAEADLGGLDILINTAPAKVFDVSLPSFPRDLRIIDLASGDNFPGIDVEKYPSIPAKMFPYTAGRAWGRSIERFADNIYY